MQKRLLSFLALTAAGCLVGTSHAASRVVAWGATGSSVGETNVPAGLSNVVAISGGATHSLALEADGSVVAWGGNISGQGNVPTNFITAIAIEAGHSHNLALREDGLVAAWGLNNFGQATVPPGLAEVVTFSAGNGHNLALLRDGTVAAWGANNFGQSQVPPGLTGVAGVGTGLNHSLAIRSNGTVVAWGNNSFQQSSVPAGLSNVISVAGGSSHSVALRSDGSVVVWGANGAGQTNVPPGLNDVMEIAAGSAFSMALRRDGTVAAWGSNLRGETNVPPGLSNVVAIAAGHFHALAIVGDGLPEIISQPASLTVDSGRTATFAVRARGPSLTGVQWRKNGAAILDATNRTLTLSNVQPIDVGNYAVLVSNINGTALSVEASLQVLENPPTIAAPPLDQTVALGGTAMFEVVAAGSLPIAYAWRYNGTNLAGATDSRVTFANVTFADTGTLEVAISNAFGAVTSAPVRLFVTLSTFPGSVDLSFNAGDATDGVVRALATQPGGKVVVGGWFQNMAGVQRPWLTRLNSDGSLDPSFAIGSGPNGAVLAMETQADGKLIVAGEFTSFDGVPRQYVARLLPDGGLDGSFNPSPGGFVWAVAVQSDGKVWIGGDFQNVGGVLTRGLARLLSNGNLDTTGGASNADGFVRALTLDRQGRLIAGGNFIGIGGMPRQALARIGTNGLVDTTFQASLPQGAVVQAVAVQADDRIVIGGFLNSLSGPFRGNLARVMDDGTLDAGFNVGADGGISSIITLPDGKLIVGGGFTFINDRPRGRIARLHPSGELDRGFESDPGADGWIEKIVVDENGDIVIGGAFTQYDNLLRPSVARLHGRNPPPFPPVFISTATDQTVKEGVNLSLATRVRSFPESILQWQFNGTAIAGATNDILPLRNIRFANTGTYSLVASNALGMATGAVTTVTVIPAPTHPGSLDIDFYSGSGVSGIVFSVVLQSDRKILTGGNFMSVDGVSQTGVTRLNATGLLDTTFTGRHGYVRMLALQPDRRIVAGGYFPASVARLLTNGDPDTSFATAGVPADFVYAVGLQSNGKVVTAGNLPITGQMQVRRYAANGILDTNFVVHSTSLGSALALVIQPDDKIVIGGRFTDINGMAVGRVARLNADGTLDSSFNAGVGVNERVNAIARQADGKILIAGQFTRVNGTLRNRIARLNANGSLDATFNPGSGPNGAINALALAASGQILIAGEFTSVAGIARAHVARLNADGSLDSVFNTSVGPDEDVHAITVDPDGSVLIGGEFYAIDGVPRPGVARLRGGGPATAAPVIIVPPTNQVVTAGEDVSLTVLATAVPAPTYQWQFNGEDIPGANQWILTIPNVRSTNGGTYRVTVSNVHGTIASQDAVVSVLVPSRTAGKPDIDFYIGAGPNDRVTAILPLSDGRIIIGGAFTAFDGTPRGHIARLEKNGTLDPTFASGPGANGTVNALALQADGKVIMGGAFSSVHGTTRDRIARLHEDGSLDASFDPGAVPDGEVFATAVLAGGQILVGGTFQTIGGISNAAIARLDGSGAIDTSFGSPFRPGSSVLALGLQTGGRIIAGGILIGENGTFRTLTRLTNSGLIDSTYLGNSASPNASVLTLAVRPDDQILVGGYFITAGGVSHLRVAQLTADGLSNGSFDPGLAASNVVRAVALQGDGRALIGGDFTGISSAVLNRIARLTTNGLVDATFQPGTGVTGGTRFTDEYGELIDQTSVLAIAIESSGSILIGGDFTKVNDITRPGLARLYDHELVSTIQIRPLPGTTVELFWEVGVLQQAPDLSGPWTDVSRAAGTYEVSLQGELRFFRLRLN